jgi:K+-transporting ATPase ATPase B chain
VTAEGLDMHADAPEASSAPRTKAAARTDWKLIRAAVLQSFVKLNPGTLWHNPVMFVVEIGSAICTFYVFADLVDTRQNVAFLAAIAFWLWFTVLFANFAEAMAEGRGKAQADTLRQMATWSS